MMSKKRLLSVVLILVFGTVFYLLFIKKTSINSLQNTDEQKDIFFEVKLKSLDLDLDLIANWSFSDTVDLAFKVGGILEPGEIEMKQGISFKKNELLFQMNNRTAFLNYLSVKNQFRSQVEESIQLLEKLLLPSEMTKWNSFFNSLQDSQLMLDFPLVNNQEELKIIQNLNLKKRYSEVKSLENKMSNYFYLAPFDGKVLNVNAKVGGKINKNQVVAQLVSSSSKTIKVTLDSAEFQQIFSVEKAWIESKDLHLNLDWNAKKVLHEKGKVSLLFKRKDLKTFKPNQSLRFRLIGKSAPKYAVVPANSIQNGKVKLAHNHPEAEVSIVDSFKDSVIVLGLKRGMSIKL